MGAAGEDDEALKAVSGFEFPVQGSAGLVRSLDVAAHGYDPMSHTVVWNPTFAHRAPQRWAPRYLDLWEFNHNSMSHTAMDHSYVSLSPEWILRRRLLAMALALLVRSVACSKTNLRGTFKASQDGQTYLGSGRRQWGRCGSIKIAGRVWPHPIGEAGPIDPGHHTIQCAGEIGFRYPAGRCLQVRLLGP